MRSAHLVTLFAGFLCWGSLTNPVAAQSLYTWGHPSTYGQGYVGTPSYVPATSYYRAPQITNYAPSMPVSTYYAPQLNPVPQNVVPVTYAAPVANYPAQTVFPANYSTNYATVPAYPLVNNYQTYRPVYYTPAPYANYYQPAPVANYATPAFYRTNYARTPVTYYRPVQVMDPVSGGVNTVLQPATGYEWQARRYQTYRVFPLFNRNQQTNYAGTCCNGAGCGSCGGYTNANPYYVPNNPVPYSPYATPSTTGVYPAGPTTIAPPTTYNPGSVSSGTTLPPANTIPSLNSAPAIPLNPTDLNSGPTRRDYAPALDSYPYRPNTSSIPYSPATESAPATLPTLPADTMPSLNGPSNNTIESRRPQATIRRELDLKPVPDPEVSGTSLKLSEPPPPLLRSGDRTAQADSTQLKHKLMSYEREIREAENIRTTTNKPAMKIHGDDAWRPAGK